MAREVSLKEFNHVDLLFPSKFLKSADLRGKRVPVVIESISPREELQMQGGKKEKKPVLYLRGKDKAWVLNKTNAQSIAAVHGPEVTHWIGKTVVIYGARVPFGNKTVDGIRVDEEASAKHASKPAEEPHDAETGEVDPATSMPDWQSDHEPAQ